MPFADATRALLEEIDMARAAYETLAAISRRSAIF